jgi:hypothetical protein
MRFISSQFFDSNGCFRGIELSDELRSTMGPKTKARWKRLTVAGSNFVAAKATLEAAAERVRAAEATKAATIKTLSRVQASPSQRAHQAWKDAVATSAGF